MTTCRWSGWPGAWCLDCGRADPMEVCLANHAVWVNEGSSDGGMSGHFECPDGTHKIEACSERMSRRHDPYAEAELKYSPEDQAKFVEVRRKLAGLKWSNAVTLRLILDYVGRYLGRRP